MAVSVTPERIAELLGDSPAWARVGLTAPNARLRVEAAAELGQYLTAALERPAPPTRDAAQLALPLR